MNLLNAIQVNTPIIEASMKQEIILLFVGGFIAILSSIATLLVTNLIDKHGIHKRQLRRYLGFL